MKIIYFFLFELIWFVQLLGQPFKMNWHLFYSAFFCIESILDENIWGTIHIKKIHDTTRNTKKNIRNTHRWIINMKFDLVEAEKLYEKRMS